MKVRSDPICDYLPARLPAVLRRERVSVTAFTGLAAGGGEDAGTVAAMVNLSPMSAPSLAVRHPRGLYLSARDTSTPHGMALMNGVLYFVQGTTLYRSGASQVAVSVGSVSDTDKQFAVFGDRLLLFPDKLYVDASDGYLHAMELDTGVLEAVDFTGNTITLPEGTSWQDLGFAAGDGISVLNVDDVTPAPEGSYRISRVQGRVAYLTRSFAASYVSNARILRSVPNLEGLCVSGERVYGFSGKDVYVSAAGSAFNWYATGADDGSDPATLHTGSEGDFTACAPWQGYVVFFKSDRICKLLGSRADSFVLSESTAPGIPAALAKTLCEVNGALYYHAVSGVYRYGGQSPERVGRLTDAAVTDGCGGTDGAVYYLAVGDGAGAWRQYVYVPEAGTWYAEDDLHPVGGVCREGFFCEQAANGYIWLSASDGRVPVCSFNECLLYGALASSVTLLPDHRFEPEGYRLTEVCIRATAEAGATLRVVAFYADGRAEADADADGGVELACFAGSMSDRLLRIPVYPRRCDGVTLRLEMSGHWVIHAVLRTYERGGQ